MELVAAAVAQQLHQQFTLLLSRSGQGKFATVLFHSINLIHDVAGMLLAEGLFPSASERAYRAAAIHESPQETKRLIASLRVNLCRLCQLTETTGLQTNSFW
jgi:hypothetical protein